MNTQILSVQLRAEPDLVHARKQARHVAGLLGFDTQDQARVATAVSEIARNAYRYAGGGEISFEIAGDQMLLVQVRDRGPGIPALQQILLGQFRSGTGMGIGITGTRRLMDHFEIETTPGNGTTVTFGKMLPKRAQDKLEERLQAALRELGTSATGEEPFIELQEQNRELLGAFAELNMRQDELARLNNELEDTNRGVVALYAELDEKAERLRLADELKSKFLSNMSHEFRTPLNSILALSRILLDRTDGDLTPEQEKQVMFIRKGAESLAELVNDLLDLAKVESGKVDVLPTVFTTADLFGTMRGMLRPLLLNDQVNLIFEENSEIAPIVSDEGKIAQILRNLVSNALKFTDQGEVRVSVTMDAEHDEVTFTVADTGIGIPPEHRESIFQEFTQIQNPLQSRVKGTGLGLPLSRKLAELLGGTITVESSVGVGSSFFLTIPRRYRPEQLRTAATNYLKQDETAAADSARRRRHVLVIDDEESARYLIRRMFKGPKFHVVEAAGGTEGLKRAGDDHPDLIILDLVMPDLSGFEVLEKLKDDNETRVIPVVIVTSKPLEPAERAWLLDRAEAVLFKESVEPDSMLPLAESILNSV